MTLNIMAFLSIFAEIELEGVWWHQTLAPLFSLHLHGLSRCLKKFYLKRKIATTNTSLALLPSSSMVSTMMYPPIILWISITTFMKQAINTAWHRSLPWTYSKKASKTYSFLETPSCKCSIQFSIVTMIELDWRSQKFIIRKSAWLKSHDYEHTIFNPELFLALLI